MPILMHVFLCVRGLTLCVVCAQDNLPKPDAPEPEQPEADAPAQEVAVAA